jgi:polysaccharide biosynthesis/export protein
MLECEELKMTSRESAKAQARAQRLGIALAVICAISTPLSAQDTNQPTASQSIAKPAVPADTVAVPKQQSRPASDDSFIVGPEDVLAINVWKEPDVSRSVPVRSDGKISLPLVGELQASGQTPRQLEREISTKLQNFISEPEVTVIVQEAKSQRFNILGQVARPGSYLLSNTSTVLDAIALAGGFRDFAKKKSIYVLRQNPDGTQSHLAFNFKEVIQGKNSDQNVRLKPRDTVVIP